MLVSTTVHHSLILVPLVGALLALVFLKRRWRRRPRARLPLIAGFLLGAVLFVMVMRVHGRVLVVSEHEGTVEAHEQWQLGAASFTGRGAPFVLPVTRGATWIVNDTTRPVTVEKHSYTSVPLAGEGPTAWTIAPGTAGNVATNKLLVGPDHPPPASISSSSASEDVYWVSW